MLSDKYVSTWLPSIFQASMICIDYVSYLVAACHFSRIEVVGVTIPTWESLSLLVTNNNVLHVGLCSLASWWFLSHKIHMSYRIENQQ